MGGRALAQLAAGLWLAVASGRCLSLQIDRATAHSLLINVICEAVCDGDLTWEYKSSPSEPWRSPGVLRHLSNRNARYIVDLQSNAPHYVRVRQNSTGIYSNEVKGWTCDERLPTPTGLRVAAAGPGWLDIRWTPPSEDCSSRFYYHLRYKSQRGNYSRNMTYGYLKVSKSQVFARPSHPCDPHGKEFCVLLTDNVEPGQHHIVLLQVERIGGDESESTDVMSIPAYANPQNTGPVDVKWCADTTSVLGNTPELKDNEERPETAADGVALPLWAAALLGTIFLLALSVVVGYLTRDRFMKTVDDKKETEEPPRRNSECSSEERYVRPRTFTTAVSWKKSTELNDEIPVYEEIGIHQIDNSHITPRTPILPNK